VPLAHSYLEPQADGSVKLTKQNLSGGELKGGPKTWNLKNLKNKIKEQREVAEQLQKITDELSTLTITIPDMIWRVPYANTPLPLQNDAKENDLTSTLLNRFSHTPVTSCSGTHASLASREMDRALDDWKRARRSR
jgi:hypothetical protein